MTASMIRRDEFSEMSGVNPDVHHVTFCMADNSHNLAPGSVERMLRTLTPDEAAVRVYGQERAAFGVVYREFDPERHVVDPFPIPPAWPRWRAMDYGYRNPSAIVWGAVSPIGWRTPQGESLTEEVLWVYRELYERERTVPQLADSIRELSQGEKYQTSGVIIDPAAFSVSQSNGTSIPDANLVAFDGRCPFSDIPMGWNINIPRPYLPYGMGEPERLEDIQQAIIQAASILHQHSRYYQFPMLLWPESLVNRMEAAGVAPYAKPGRMLPIDDGMWMQLAAGNGRGLTFEPPPIPGEFVDYLTILLNEHDRLSGHVSVLQGSPDKPDMSGVAIAQLQEAARGPLGFKSRHTQWTLQHVGRVMLDAIVKLLPPREWARIVNQVPPPVLERFRQRILESEFDVEVEVVSGKGLMREAEAMQARELFKEQLLSQTTAMERNSVENVEEEKRRMRGDMQEQASAMAPPAPQQPTPPAA